MPTAFRDSGSTGGHQAFVQDFGADHILTSKSALCQRPKNAKLRMIDRDILMGFDHHSAPTLQMCLDDYVESASFQDEH